DLRGERGGRSVGPSRPARGTLVPTKTPAPWRAAASASVEPIVLPFSCDTPQVASASRPTMSLGAAATSFVGREADLEAVAELLRVERLVTILGAPGSGKTRLAVELARKLREAVDTGERQRCIWACDLADAENPEDICAAVGHALEVPLTLGTSD